MRKILFLILLLHYIISNYIVLKFSSDPNCRNQFDKNEQTFNCQYNASNGELNISFTENIRSFKYFFGRQNTNSNSGIRLYNLVSIISLSIDSSLVESMEGMFARCPYIQSIDLSSLNTSSVTNMSYMFSLSNKLISINLSNFDTSKVIDMRYMFSGKGVNWFEPDSQMIIEWIDLSSFNTSSVTDMRYMFYNCLILESIDLSSFNTSKVTNMEYMFYGRQRNPDVFMKLKSLDLSNFDTSLVTTMSNMFTGCNELVLLDISNFNMTKVRVSSTFRMFYKFNDNLAYLNLYNIEGDITFDFLTNYEGTSSKILSVCQRRIFIESLQLEGQDKIKNECCFDYNITTFKCDDNFVLLFYDGNEIETKFVHKNWKEVSFIIHVDNRLEKFYE